MLVVEKLVLTLLYIGSKVVKHLHHILNFEAIAIIFSFFNASPCAIGEYASTKIPLFLQNSIKSSGVLEI